MRFFTTITHIPDAEEAVTYLVKSLHCDGLSSVICYFTESYSAEALHMAFTRHLPGIPVIGCSSSRGIMTQKGVYEGPVIGIMAIYGTDLCAYGTAILDWQREPDIPRAVSILIDEALIHADREGEVPNLVILHGTPGNEEDIIRAIDRKFGTLVPMIGGSAADNAIDGKWELFTSQGWTGNGVAIQLIFTAKPIATGFSAGYLPTEFVGTVTRACGRFIHEIDNEPARRIYKEWISDHSSVQISDQYVFEHVTRFPLGRIAGQVYGKPYYKLSHPIRMTRQGALEMFTDVAIGDTVTLMYGSQQQLIERPARVVKEANSSNYQNAPVLGCVAIVCAGAMLRLGEDIVQAQKLLTEEMGTAPFICPFTFGEQGRFIGGENAHGNLMISSVIFYDNE